MKTITSLRHALACIMALTFIAANSLLADEAPDLDDPEIFKLISEAALNLKDAERRNDLYFAKDSLTPYTGWIIRARIRDSLNSATGVVTVGKPLFLAQLKEGKFDGLYTLWNETGRMILRTVYKKGKIDGDTTRWSKIPKPSSKQPSSKKAVPIKE